MAGIWTACVASGDPYNIEFRLRRHDGAYRWFLVRGLKVLFVTGYAENAAIRSGFLYPEMEMITKPFALDQLAAKICEMIER